MKTDEPHIVAERDGVVLRHATRGDLSRLDEITIICYEPIADSFIDIIGQEFYKGTRLDPESDWRDSKTQQVRGTYQQHPDRVWVLEGDGHVFGFVTFGLVPERNMGFLDNNGVLPEYWGSGWGTFMYRHVLQHFRNQGIRFVWVETDLDEPHVPARRAYEAVGFDRQQRIVIYRQDLGQRNPGSEPAREG